MVQFDLMVDDDDLKGSKLRHEVVTMRRPSASATTP